MIDLTMLWPRQVIALYDQGVITLAEIRASGAADRCFGPGLADWLYERLNEEETVITTEEDAA